MENINLNGNISLLRKCHEHIQKSFIGDRTLLEWGVEYLTPSHVYEGAREDCAIITGLGDVPKEKYKGILISLPTSPDAGTHEIVEAYFSGKISYEEIEKTVGFHQQAVENIGKNFIEPQTIEPASIYRKKRIIEDIKLGEYEYLGKLCTVKILNSKELEKVGPLMISAWTHEENEYNMAIPSSFLEGAGTTLGILDNNDNLLAFSFSIPTNKEKIALSHATGVSKEKQAEGLGEVIKEFQFKQLINEGYERVVWTYDPLLSVNSNLNISKLGAVSNAYLRNVYGAIAKGGIYNGLVADRFKVDVDLNNRRKGIKIDENDLEKVAVLISNEKCEIKSSLNLQDVTLGQLTVEIPSEFEVVKYHEVFERYYPGISIHERIKMTKEKESRKHIKELLKTLPEEEQMATAIKWRNTTAAIFENLFEKGYAVEGFQSYKVDDLKRNRRSFHILSKKKN